MVLIESIAMRQLVRRVRRERWAGVVGQVLPCDFCHSTCSSSDVALRRCSDHERAAQGGSKRGSPPG